MVILIVDDNQAMRTAVRAMLAEVEEDFCECADGSEATGAYRTCHPDWVIMDVRLPHVDGITATAFLCATFPEARILVISNYDDPDISSQALRAGAVDFVSKDDLSRLAWIIAGRSDRGADA